jgi:DNA invertase Pin-like site-specific DNA recombinase
VPTKQPIAAIYVRVSTEDQKTDMQLTELREYATRQGWIITEYSDKISGAKARRPGLDLLMEDARMKRVDVVLVWKMDRFGRKMRDVLTNILSLDQYGVRFIAMTQGIDTDTRNPASRFYLHILAAVAELERDMIVERVNAGVAQFRRDYAAGRIGRDKHSKSGRDLAHGRPHRIFRRDRALELKARGVSLRKIAAELGVPLTTVVRSLKTVPKTS